MSAWLSLKSIHWFWDFSVHVESEMLSVRKGRAYEKKPVFRTLVKTGG